MDFKYLQAGFGIAMAATGAIADGKVTVDEFVSIAKKTLNGVGIDLDKIAIEAEQTSKVKPVLEAVSRVAQDLIQRMDDQRLNILEIYETISTGFSLFDIDFNEIGLELE